ncbi:hypothetical protein GCM10018777_48190 [Streptomyces albogriseolus]|nr:hypothetical protein GCM10018777_48190 [Streptomyces viridodiastaticus]
MEVLAVLAPDLAAAARTAARKAFVILDGTLLPIDRIAADRPYYCGKHRKHGMNVQVIADPFGRLLWASPALPGAVHDIKAARTHGIIDILAEAGVACWTDKGYQGAGATVRVPYRGRWEKLYEGQRAANVSHAKIRALGEQAMATLKSWRLLRKLRCSTTRILPRDALLCVRACSNWPAVSYAAVAGGPHPESPATCSCASIAPSSTEGTYCLYGRGTLISIGRT